MISGSPLFRGRDNNDQLLHIMRIIGTPSEAQFQKICKETVSLFLGTPLVLNNFHTIAGDHPQAVPEVCQNALSTSPTQGISTG
jgi:hypothetical protein